MGLLPVASATQTDCRYSVIAGGLSHSLAVQEDGSDWGWGGNSYGQLGNGGNANGTTPRSISLSLSTTGSYTINSYIDERLGRRRADHTTTLYGTGLVPFHAGHERADQALREENLPVLEQCVPVSLGVYAVCDRLTDILGGNGMAACTAALAPPREQAQNLVRLALGRADGTM